MDEKIMKLQELIDGHDNIVFFGGAGVSTESGIPDFRSQDGLYHQKYDFPPETILSHSFFLSHPNIDNLHQMAGSQKVLELHGSVYRNHCMRCGKSFDFAHMKHSTGVPRCECGGMIKPDVVLYEEGLDTNTIEESVRAISNAQILIIGGTSLAVYPAAVLIDYFRGEALVVINKSSTPRDRNADLLIKEPIGQVFSQIKVNQK